MRISAHNCKLLFFFFFAGAVARNVCNCNLSHEVESEKTWFSIACVRQFVTSTEFNTRKAVTPSAVVIDFGKNSNKPFFTVPSRKNKNSKGRRAFWKVLKKTLGKKDLKSTEGKKYPLLSHKNYRQTICSLKLFSIW